MLHKDDSVIKALYEALTLAPDNSALRKHLADLLFEKGDFANAEKEYRQVLATNPDDEEIKAALAETFLRQEKWLMALVILEELMKAYNPPAQIFSGAARAYLAVNKRDAAAVAYAKAMEKDPALSNPELEAQLETSHSTEADELVRIPVEDWPQKSETQLERSGIAFKDVGGMDKLKEEIRVKIIHPLNHPEIYKAYGKTIGGGILMYGPPGCGKTHLAKATAGEVNAYFLSIGIHDVLNMYLGQSENNLHELFQLARHHTPCVLFIDEVDALGANRTDMRQSAGRQIINQLLAELDGIGATNDGILILAATNAPWHLDPALRRPGRFDRMIFVPPPDLVARAAILEVMLREKPNEAINYQQIAKSTVGFSGADLKGIVDLAIEEKVQEAISRGNITPLATKDLLTAAKKTKPTTQEWFATARNYAVYANTGGIYDDILEHLDLNNEGGFFPKLPFKRGD